MAVYRTLGPYALPIVPMLSQKTVPERPKHPFLRHRCLVVRTPYLILRFYFG